MTTNLFKNGEWSISLRADEPAELAVLEQFAARAEKGTRVSLEKIDGGVKISMQESK